MHCTKSHLAKQHTQHNVIVFDKIKLLEKSTHLGTFFFFRSKYSFFSKLTNISGS